MIPNLSDYELTSLMNRARHYGIFHIVTLLQEAKLCILSEAAVKGLSIKRLRHSRYALIFMYIDKLITIATTAKNTSQGMILPILSFWDVNFERP